MAKKNKKIVESKNNKNSELSVSKRDDNVEYVVIVEHLSKSFSRCANDWQRLKAILFPSKKQGRWKVLDDISFKIKRGERVGFLGRNGSGKSTILKILSGITIPDSGKVEVMRKANILLEVSAGFNHEFTGRENIMIRGILLGMTKKEIKEVEQKIIDFTEIDESFIDQQLKRYSSGMIAKLGIGINFFCKPEILIVDEALAVGDVAFQKKCMDTVEQIYQEYKCTLLFVSHSEFLVRKFCNRAIVISDTKIAYDGDVDGACKKYNEIMGNTSSTDANNEKKSNKSKLNKKKTKKN